jgi:Rps23 Pro-64 3,4-dihydroxylase Tpa1-like proline 4-hydroxylase
MINLNRVVDCFKNNLSVSPFMHFEIDRFLPDELAQKANAEFPDFGSDIWYSYKNQIEDKKALNDWNKFPENTYKIFTYLTGEYFVRALSNMIGVTLFPDPGLHGGGWHMHGNGGKLNPHLDYNIHPKLGLQRKLNLIIYLCENWSDSWGGHFGLWEHDKATSRPGNLVKEIPVGFNRAVIFDTTQNSWHGLSREVVAPEKCYRKSLAVYYLCEPPLGAENRGRALFAPTESQIGDPSIEELIRKRAQVHSSHQVYRDNNAK